ncbi:MAG: putative SOS response-associated peptidase YedK [Myxococcota bacterium]|jgi:putative SOS response-associated peptidase YedK
MCGRFTQTADAELLKNVFDLAEAPEVAANFKFNIAPTDPVVAVRPAVDSDGRRADLMRWGLVPPWRKDFRKKPPLINARAETVHKLRPFRDAFKRRRCLVVADGWYEWRHLPDGKQPFRFVRHDRRPFGLAGLWERFFSDDGTVMESCTVLTVPPNPLCAEVHDRMPLILPPKHWDAWLDETVEPDALAPLLVTPEQDELEFYAVARDVNSVRNRGADLINEIQPSPVQTELF